MSNAHNYLWMLGDVVAQVFGAMREVTLVAVRTRAALDECPAKPRFVERRHRVLRLPVLIFVVHEVAL